MESQPICVKNHFIRIVRYIRSAHTFQLLTQTFQVLGRASAPNGEPLEIAGQYADTRHLWAYIATTDACHAWLKK